MPTDSFDLNTPENPPKEHEFDREAERTFEPRMRSGERHELMSRWHEAVKRSLAWDVPALPA